MNQETKQDMLFDLRLKEIDALDRETTTQFYKLLGIFGAASLFAYVMGWLSEARIISLLIALLFVVLVVLYMQIQANKYIKDCYESLHRAVRNGKLDEFRLPNFSSIFLFYYQKRY